MAVKAVVRRIKHKKRKNRKRSDRDKMIRASVTK